MKIPPKAYFITFCCYGIHVHGDEPYSVDRHNCGYDKPAIDDNKQWAQFERKIMKQRVFHMEEQDRSIVLKSIVDLCLRRSWRLFAAHIRRDHVHVVIQAPQNPETVMNALKAFATRRIKDFGLLEKSRKLWSRHGSTRYIWDEKALSQTIDYVIRGQGKPMTFYEEIPK